LNEPSADSFLVGGRDSGKRWHDDVGEKEDEMRFEKW